MVKEKNSSRSRKRNKSAEESSTESANSKKKGDKAFRDRYESIEKIGEEGGDTDEESESNGDSEGWDSRSEADAQDSRKENNDPIENRGDVDSDREGGTNHAADFIEYDSGSTDEVLRTKSSSKSSRARGRSPKRSSRTPSKTSSKSSSKSKKDVDDKKKEQKLKSMHNAATRYLKDGQNKKALILFKKILRVHTDHYWNEHSRIGAALHNIAIVHLRTGNLDDAADAIEEAVRVRTLALGEHNSKVVDSKIEQGIILLARDEHQEALQAFNQCLEVCERRAFLGEKDLLMSKIQNNIGCVHFASGDLNYAYESFQSALRMQRGVIEGSEGDKPSVMVNLASTLCNIGYVHVENDSFDDAIEALEEAIEIQRNILDEEDPLVFDTLDNLGFAFAIEGHLDDAMKHYDELLDLQEEYLGSDHLDCAETLKKMTYVDLKRYHLEDAREKIQRTLRIQQKNLKDEENRSIKKTKKLLDDVNYEIMRYPSAREAIQSLFACFYSAPEYMAYKHCKIDKPENRGKVSGHKIAYY